MSSFSSLRSHDTTFGEFCSVLKFFVIPTKPSALYSFDRTTKSYRCWSWPRDDAWWHDCTQVCEIDLPIKMRNSLPCAALSLESIGPNYPSVQSTSTDSTRFRSTTEIQIWNQRNPRTCTWRRFPRSNWTAQSRGVTWAGLCYQNDMFESQLSALNTALQEGNAVWKQSTLEDGLIAVEIGFKATVIVVDTIELNTNVYLEFAMHVAI